MASGLKSLQGLEEGAVAWIRWRLDLGGSEMGPFEGQHVLSQVGGRCV